MPSKLKLLLGLLGLSVVVNMLMGHWLAFAVDLGLLIGVAKGNDAVRGLLTTLAWLGLVSSSMTLLFGVFGFVAAIDAGAVETLAARVVPMVVGASGAAEAGFFIWCLRQRDVQTWMFDRSLRLVEG